MTGLSRENSLFTFYFYVEMRNSESDISFRIGNFNFRWRRIRTSKLLFVWVNWILSGTFCSQVFPLSCKLCPQGVSHFWPMVLLGKDWNWPSGRRPKAERSPWLFPFNLWNRLDYSAMYFYFPFPPHLTHSIQIAQTRIGEITFKAYEIRRPTVSVPMLPSPNMSSVQR